MPDTKTIAHASFRLIETGDAELARQIIAPNFINEEAEDDPEDVERRQHGPEGFLATSRWLRDAFSNLRFELQETVAEGNTVMAAATMTGQHTGPFNGIAPTGRPITINKSTSSPSPTARSPVTAPSAMTSACCCSSAGGLVIPPDKPRSSGCQSALRAWINRFMTAPVCPENSRRTG